MLQLVLPTIAHVHEYGVDPPALPWIPICACARRSCRRLRPRAMTSWTNYGAHARARSLGQHRVPERSARARDGRCEAPRRGHEDRATVAAEGRRYGSHAGTNTSGRARASPPFRARASQGQLKGRTKRPHLRRHEPAPASQPRGTGSPATPVPSAVGLPLGSGHRRRRGKGTGPTDTSPKAQLRAPRC